MITADITAFDQLQIRTVSQPCRRVLTQNERANMTRYQQDMWDGIPTCRPPTTKLPVNWYKGIRKHLRIESEPTRIKSFQIGCVQERLALMSRRESTHSYEVFYLPGRGYVLYPNSGDYDICAWMLFYTMSTNDFYPTFSKMCKFYAKNNPFVKKFRESHKDDNYKLEIKELYRYGHVHNLYDDHNLVQYIHPVFLVLGYGSVLHLCLYIPDGTHKRNRITFGVKGNIFSKLSAGKPLLPNLLIAKWVGSKNIFKTTFGAEPTYLPLRERMRNHKYTQPTQDYPWLDNDCYIADYTDKTYELWEFHYPMDKSCVLHTLALAGLYYCIPKVQDFAEVIIGLTQFTEKSPFWFEYSDQIIHKGKAAQEYLRSRSFKFNQDVYAKRAGFRTSGAYDLASFITILEDLGIPQSDGTKPGVKIYKLQRGFHATFIWKGTKFTTQPLAPNDLPSPLGFRTRCALLDINPNENSEDYLRALLDHFSAHDKAVTIFQRNVPVMTNTRYMGLRSLGHMRLDWDGEKWVGSDINALRIKEETSVHLSVEKTFIEELKEESKTVTSEVEELKQNPIPTISTRSLLPDISDPLIDLAFDIPPKIDKIYGSQIRAALRDLTPIDCIGEFIHDYPDRFAIIDFPRMTGVFRLFDGTYIDANMDKMRLRYNYHVPELGSWGAQHHPFPYRFTSGRVNNDNFRLVKKYRVGPSVNVLVIEKTLEPQRNMIDALPLRMKSWWYDDIQRQGTTFSGYSLQTFDALASMWLLIDTNSEKVRQGSRNIYLEAFNFCKVCDKDLQGEMTKDFVTLVDWINSRYIEHQESEKPKRKLLDKDQRLRQQNQRYEERVKYIYEHMHTSRLLRFDPNRAHVVHRDIAWLLFWLAWLPRIFLTLAAILSTGYLWMSGAYQQFCLDTVGVMAVTAAYMEYRKRNFNWKRLYQRIVDLELPYCCNVCYLRTTNCRFCDNTAFSLGHVAGNQDQTPTQQLYVTPIQVQPAVTRQQWQLPCLGPDSVAGIEYRTSWYNFSNVKVGPWFASFTDYYRTAINYPYKQTAVHVTSLLNPAYRKYDPTSLEATWLGAIFAMFKRQGQVLVTPDPAYLEDINLGILNKDLWRRAMREVEIPTFEEYLKQVDSSKREKYRQSYAKFLRTTTINAKYNAFVKIGENGPYIAGRKNRNICNPHDTILGPGGYFNFLLTKTTKHYIQLLFDHDDHFKNWPLERRQTFFIHAMNCQEIEDSIRKAAMSYNEEIEMLTLDIRNFDAHQGYELFKRVDFSYIGESRPLLARLGYSRMHVKNLLKYATSSTAKIDILAAKLLTNPKIRSKAHRILLCSVKTKQTTFSGDPLKTTWGNTMRQTHLVICATRKWVLPDGTRLLDWISLRASGDDLKVFYPKRLRQAMYDCLSRLYQLTEAGGQHGCGYQVKEIIRNSESGKFLSKEVQLKVINGKVVDVAFYRSPQKIIETGVSSVKNRLIPQEMFNYMIHQQLKSQIHDPIMNRILEERVKKLPMSEPSKKVVQHFEAMADHYWKSEAHRRTHCKEQHWIMHQDPNVRLLYAGADVLRIILTATSVR